jgi:hypothetical protein
MQKLKTYPMKTSIPIFLFIIFSNVGIGQTNLFKFQLGYFFYGDAHVSGLAYEYVPKKNFGLQLSLIESGYSLEDTDGNNQINVSLTPEFRYYPFSKSIEEVRQSFYISAISVFAYKNVHFGGGREADAPISANEHSWQPGLLIGKSFKIGKSWQLELFAGPKYKFAKEDLNYRQGMTPNTGSDYYQAWRLRAGFWIGWSLF